MFASLMVRRSIPVLRVAGVCAALALLPDCGCNREPGVGEIEVLSPDGQANDQADPYLIVNFGDVDSTLGVVKTVIVRNVGEGDLEINQACFVDGPIEEANDAACTTQPLDPYTLSSDIPLTLAPGAETEIRVGYTPELNAPQKVLRIDSSDADEAKVAMLVVGSADIIPGSLSGCICNDGVGWVENASISIQHELGTLTTTADEDGCFLFQQVPSGDRVVEAVGADYSTSLPVEVVARQHNTVGPEVCNSPKGDIVGCVCNEDAYQWLVGGSVSVTTEDGNLTAVTDNDGCFYMEEVPTGAQTVIVSSPGFYQEWPVTVEGSEIVAIPTPATCEPPTGSLTGCPCNEAVYMPAPGATITVNTIGFGQVSGTIGADGCFTLDDVPFGTHTATVDDGNGYQQSWPVDIQVGETTALPGPAVCAPCSFEQIFDPVVTTDPVDIIMVIDSSGSMQNENDAVEANLNAFSQSITASGIDHRVILIGRAQAPAPLGNSANYLRVNTEVRSHDALLEILGHYDDYKGFLRPDSVKHFIAITDDTSQLNQASFTATINSLNDPGFGDNWVFHSIVGYGPVPQVGCSSAAGIGTNYLQLAANTGGYTAQICNADFTDVFNGIYAAVTFAGLPCTMPLDPPPSGSSFDAANVDVTWVKGGGQQQLLPRNDTCNGDGWRYDNPSAPTEIQLCESSCSDVDGENTGQLKLGLGCVFD